MRSFLLALLLTSCSHTRNAPCDPILPCDPLTESPADPSVRIAFLLQSGNLDEALASTRALRAQDPYLSHTGTYDLLATYLIRQGLTSNDFDDIFMSLHGLSLIQNESLLPLVRPHIASDNPLLQLVAIRVVASYPSDTASALLAEAMRSDYFFVRLEAAYEMAIRHLPGATQQLEALYAKADPMIRPYLAEPLAIDGSPAAIHLLRHMLRDEEEAVRVAAILAVAQAHCEELAAEIELHATDSSSSIKEAVAFAMSYFSSNSSTAILQQLAIAQDPNVALMASFALYSRGATPPTIIEEEVRAHHNPMAIALLGKTPELLQEWLEQQLHAPDLLTSTNATIALLERHNPKALQTLPSLLITDPRDLHLEPAYSASHALTCWRAIPSQQQAISDPFRIEISQRAKEHFLTQASYLPESDFLALALQLFESQQNSLIPTLTHLLEDLRSPAAIALLQQQRERIGSPYIRASCNLALFRLGETGPYQESLRQFVRTADTQTLFGARKTPPRIYLPWRAEEENTPYNCTLQEQSQILVEAYEALAQAHDDEAIDSLLAAIRDGNPHNRYFLAGLLAKAAQ